MREEIWSEKIFKDDAGYFLRITKIIFAFTRKIFQFFLFIKRRLPNFVIRNVATVSDSLTFSLGLVALSLGLVALSLGLVALSLGVVTYRPRDGKFTARGTASLPPEGRHVYRPRGGK